MALIDLTESNPIVEIFAIDPNTDVLTLSLSAGISSLGQIKIEKVRLRAFAEALAELSRSVTTDLDPRQKSRMVYNLQGKTAEITFV